MTAADGPDAALLAVSEELDVDFDTVLAPAEVLAI
jgi:hypothetical protein